MPSFHPRAVRVAPIAVVSILLCTALPIELRALATWTWSPAPVDLAANVLLYAPLGWALRSRRISVPLTVAGLLSLAVEALQQGMIGRHPDGFDIVANVSGAALGFAASRRFAPVAADGPVTLTLRPAHVAVALAILSALLSIWFAPGRSSDLSSWDARYPLLLGNERTGDRAWHGKLHWLTLVPATLSPGELEQLAATSGAPPGSSVAAHGVWRSPRELAFDGGSAWVAPEPATATFIAAAVKAGGFSILASLTPEFASQTGPARFVSLSDGTYRRNFDLGQEGKGIMFRVRTPVSGENGMEPFTKSDAVLSRGKRTLVAATYDGSIARVYVDGELRGRANLAAASCLIPSLCDTDLPAALGLTAALVTLICLSYLRASGAIVIGAMIGGVAAWLMYCLATFLTARPYFAWAPFWSLSGAAALALSCARPAATRGTDPSVSHAAGPRNDDG